MKHPVFLLFICNILFFYSYAQDTPSFEDVLSLQSVSSPQISPNGNDVLFSKRAVDWESNRYDSEIWISKNGQTPYQLTNNSKGSSSFAQWSPDGKWITYLSSESGKTQIHIMHAAGGASFQLTNVKNGLSNFQWSPDGTQIAFLQAEDKTAINKKRTDKFGAYAVEDTEYNFNELWTMDFDPAIIGMMPTPEQAEDSLFQLKQKGMLLLASDDYTITSFKWSPDGSKIVFNHQPDPLRNSFFFSDISYIEVASKKVTALVANPSADSFIDWSPDSKSILYDSDLDNTTSNYYTNSNIFRINIDGSNNTQLAKDFDENIYGLNWKEAGIIGVAWQKTKRHLVQIDPKSGNAELLKNGLDRTYSISISKDGKHIAYTGNTDDSLSELFKSDLSLSTPKKLTNVNQQIKDWPTVDGEVVSWKSKDGAEIEGVLLKPKDFDPNKKYPLMVVIHGGPTGISTPGPVPSSVYPMLHWINKGALVLQPNYRGSAGYGADFRALNVRNLGVGDAWDVVSGVEHLEKQGYVDGDKVAAMGWSQGGYISAFLTTNYDKFAAISVGAGISNWMTYYVNTDIHPFTRQYLKGTPWSDKAIYEKTSPMTNINNASTPTLIQHGEFDRRVPPANAFELFQGLQDVGVDAKLVIYKGFGHGISKPKERLAAVWHNWQWFGKYIWGEEIKLPME